MAVEIHVPDVAEPLVAYRRYNISYGGPLLQGSFGGNWRPNEVFHASCYMNKKAPCGGRSSCGCGIYGHKTLSVLSPAPNSVRAKTLLWGRYFEYTRGYRAEYGQIVGIYNDHPKARKIAEAYGVPLLPIRVRDHQISELIRNPDVSLYISWIVLALAFVIVGIIINPWYFLTAGIYVLMLAIGLCITMRKRWRDRNT